MRQRIITGIFFTLGVCAFVIPSYWVPFLMVIFSIIVGAVSMREMVKALEEGNMVPSGVLIVFGGLISLLLVAICNFTGTDLITSLALYLVIMMLYSFACLVLPSVARKDGIYVRDGLITAGTILYITFPLYCLCALTLLMENGWFYMVPALMASWVSDVCAYFTGVTIGKHKIVPHISPKKTWEGCIGGAVGCAVIVMLYFDIVLLPVSKLDMNIFIASIISFVLGFVMSVMSQLGDWLASLVKRVVGIKDYGKIFPGHGGMLDRFDSSFFTLPTGVLLAIIPMLLV